MCVRLATTQRREQHNYYWFRITVCCCRLLHTKMSIFGLNAGDRGHVAVIVYVCAVLIRMVSLVSEVESCDVETCVSEITHFLFDLRRPGLDCLAVFFYVSLSCFAGRHNSLTMPSAPFSPYSSYYCCESPVDI